VKLAIRWGAPFSERLPTAENLEFGSSPRTCRAGRREFVVDLRAFEFIRDSRPPAAGEIVSLFESVRHPVVWILIHTKGNVWIKIHTTESETIFRSGRGSACVGPYDFSWWFFFLVNCSARHGFEKYVLFTGCQLRNNAIVLDGDRTLLDGNDQPRQLNRHNSRR